MAETIIFGVQDKLNDSSDADVEKFYKDEKNIKNLAFVQNVLKKIKEEEWQEERVLEEVDLEPRVTETEAHALYLFAVQMGWKK